MIVAVASVVLPVIAVFWGMAEAKSLIMNELIPLIDDLTPDSWPAEVAELGTVFRLDIVNAIIPIQEALVIVQFLITTFAAVVAVKIVVAIIKPAQAVASAMGKFAGFGLRLTAMKK